MGYRQIKRFRHLGVYFIFHHWSRSGYFAFTEQGSQTLSLILLDVKEVWDNDYGTGERQFEMSCWNFQGLFTPVLQSSGEPLKEFF